ncbi:DNA/RNA nuclease SfsA [Thermus composti]|uniref:DNA/RNA nuclease SfsA n=1 Tax=Thermus composti TaxID=532059 RepID=A0ABV6Q066_9DEIN|nr:DNA/RNA nuclease SfsA [Thermus composti]
MALPLPPSRPCRFLRRKNRFLVEADVGPLHLANSGRLTELLRPGAFCWYHPKPTPKTLGRLLLVESRGVWVGVDAGLAGPLLELLLREGVLGPCQELRREVRIGGERLDFWARLGGREAFLEAKNANRLEGTLALFPDAPTPRGARHLRLLAALAREGYGAYAVWLVQHPLAEAFALDPKDRALYQAAREAEGAGVRLLAFRVRPSLEALAVEAPLPWVWLPPEEDLEGHHQGGG